MLFNLLIFSSGIISILDVVSLGCSRGNAFTDIDKSTSLQAFGAVSAFGFSCGRGGPGSNLAISFLGGFLWPGLCGRAGKVGEALVGGFLGWAALVGGFMGWVAPVGGLLAWAALLLLAGRVSAG